MQLVFKEMLSDGHIRLLEENIKDGFTRGLLMKHIPGELSLTDYRVVFLFGEPEATKAVLLGQEAAQMELVKKRYPNLILDDSPFMTLLESEPDPRISMYRRSSFFWMVACLISMVATTTVFLASAS